MCHDTNDMKRVRKTEQLQLGRMRTRAAFASHDIDFMNEKFHLHCLCQINQTCKQKRSRAAKDVT
jgi:hypothetical protein